MLYSKLINKTLKISLLWTILAFACIESSSQNILYSPYSRFNLGNYNHRTSVASSALGNSALAMRSPTQVNVLNPASASAYDSLSFVFEIAMSGKYSIQKWKDEKAFYSNTNIEYFNSGFPVCKWWGISLGLLPFSTMGYNLVETGIIDTINYKNIYEGNGGLNQFYISNGFKISNSLSFGFNVSYIFGALDRKSVSSFPGLSTSYELRHKQSIIINDFHFRAGLQYHKKINEKNEIVIASIFENKNPVNAKSTNFTTKYLNIAGRVNIDTLDNSISNKGKVDIPMQAGLGVAYKEFDKFIIQADYLFINKSNSTVFGVNDSLNNSHFFAIGGEYIPQYNSPNKYYKRVKYRAGLNYSTTGLVLNDVSINQFGICFGAGLPLRRSKSSVNLALEFGQMGSVKNDLIKEQYFIISASLSLFEIWFVKPKFD